MLLCTTPLPSPEHELGCDEALLDACENAGGPEVLRLWEPQNTFVVLGYANRAATEVNLEFCQRSAIPVLRRCTGGGTVLQCPGCLNYSLVLRMRTDGPLKTITSTNQHIMERHREAIARLTKLPVRVEGYTDLAVDGLKFSGNAQRRKMHALLFHGSFLLDVDLVLLESALRMPSKQPEYRHQRSHREFVRNLRVDKLDAIQCLIDVWRPEGTLKDLPEVGIDHLVNTKYRQPEWNLRF